MEILTKDIDERIKANNILIKMSLEEYYDISKEILENNEFQRKRVKSSSSVYSLLKSDLEQGCLIPTIFLALEEDTNDLTNDEIIKLIKLKRDKIVILDGLQRSYTICDLLKELKDQPTLIDKVKKNRIRIELYTGINKIGILYRMLTLNTGQTPMSMRHQLEIIYSDYLNRNILGIKLIREVDEITPCNKGEYKFSDIIEGFSSYVTQNYLPMDKGDLLENIKSLENLTKDVNQKDIFKDFLIAYNDLVIKLCQITNDWEFDNDDDNMGDLKAQPFAKKAYKIFNKSQVMTGFGAAVGVWIKDGTIESFEELKNNIIPFIQCNNPTESMNIMIKNLDKIRMIAKKIGNDQRFYFYNIFKFLFDKENESYLKLDKAIDNAMRSYERVTM